MSEGVEPCQEIGVALPARCGRRPQHTISFFEGPTFRLQVGLCVKVCRVQADVTHPVPDDGDINARGKQVNGSCVLQSVGRNPFLAQSRSFLRGRLEATQAGLFFRFQFLQNFVAKLFGGSVRIELPGLLDCVQRILIAGSCG